MSDYRDLARRLREACDGHPHAKIPWPHRLLHEAAEALEAFPSAEKRSIPLDPLLEKLRRVEWANYRQLPDDLKRLCRDAAEAMERLLDALAEEHSRGAEMAQQLRAESPVNAALSRANIIEECAKVCDDWKASIIAHDIRAIKDAAPQGYTTAAMAASGQEAPAGAAPVNAAATSKPDVSDSMVDAFLLTYLSSAERTKVKTDDDLEALVKRALEAALSVPSHGERRAGPADRRVNDPLAPNAPYRRMSAGRRAGDAARREAAVSARAKQ